MTQFGAHSGMAAHRGTMILVFGIIGIVICFPLGIAAWIMGNGDLAKMNAGQMDPAGRSNTNVGRILGMISVALTVVGCIGTTLLGGLGVIMGAAVGSGGSM